MINKNKLILCIFILFFDQTKTCLAPKCPRPIGNSTSVDDESTTFRRLGIGRPARPQIYARRRSSVSLVLTELFVSRVFQYSSTFDKTLLNTSRAFDLFVSGLGFHDTGLKGVDRGESQWSSDLLGNIPNRAGDEGPKTVKPIEKHSVPRSAVPPAPQIDPPTTRMKNRRVQKSQSTRRESRTVDRSVEELESIINPLLLARTSPLKRNRVPCYSVTTLSLSHSNRVTHVHVLRWRFVIR